MGDLGWLGAFGWALVGAAVVFVVVAFWRVVAMWNDGLPDDPPSPPLGLRHPPYRRSIGRRYLTGLVVSSIMLPGLAGAATVTLLLIAHQTQINKTPTRCFLFGTAIATAVWIATGWLCRRFGDASTADDSEYTELVNRTLAAAARIDPEEDKQAATALKLAGETLGLVPGRPAATGLPWASGAGYVATRRLVHGAEEALVEKLTDDQAVCEAVNAKLSLQGSRIPGAAEQIALLDTAIRALGGGALLGPKACEPEDSPPCPPPEPITPALAKILIRNARQTIDEFRDGARNELVSARTALFGSVVATGTMAYLLLGLALLAGISSTDGKARAPVIAAVVFYVVGAVVGLFKRLHAGGRSGGRADDDFYITTIRLIETPLFAGLAAVGGVIVASLAAIGTTSGTNLSSLDQIFKVTTASIVTAAVFALTPNLLVNILADRAKKSKEDLASSQPSQGGETEPSTNEATTG